MDRIKVFLGGYVNSINSQNLNCLALARALDATQFECGVMTLYSGASTPDLDGIKIFHCSWPHRINRWITYLRGIFWCDVAYLPKREIPGFTRWLCSILHRKSFCTVEGIFDDANYESAVNAYENERVFLESFSGFNKVYAITEFVGDYPHRGLKINIQRRVLRLGVDTSMFEAKSQTRNSLKNIVFIGRILRRKGIFDFLELARAFPLHQFHLVGDGEDVEAFRQASVEQTNIHLHGVLGREALSELLQLMDLHCLLSRSEGFPRVVIETAAAGIPSVVYADYGAEGWIRSGYNGYVVTNLDEVVTLLGELSGDPGLLSRMSVNAIELAKKWSWLEVVGDWQEEIQSLLIRE